MSPDWSAKVEPVPYAKLADPQSLNLYAYVLDNPTTSLDLDGHACEASGPNACPAPPPTTTGSKSLAQRHSRVIQGLKGGGKVALGVGLVATAAFGDAPGGVAGVLLIASEGVGGAATAVSGTADIMGAATNTDVKKGDAALAAAGNLAGLVATDVSGGNPRVGAAVATISNVATLAASPREAMRNAATAADAVRTTVEGYQEAHGDWSSIKAAVRAALPLLPYLY